MAGAPCATAVHHAQPASGRGSRAARRRRPRPGVRRLLFALINESWLLWDPRRQCLHDKAAGTVVVKKSTLAPGA